MATIAVAVGIGASMTGCASTHHARPAVLHVRALLESNHMDAKGHWRTFHSPMTGVHLFATSSAGDRVTAVVDTSGNATIRLAAGRYVLTVSERDACYPSHVTLQPGTIRMIDLPCIAP